MKSDRTRLGKEITRTASAEVFAIARKTLADLATGSLEERVGAVFTRRLGEMDGTAKETLRAALRSSTDPAVVASAFEMPAEQRATIQNALNETFSAEVHVRFEAAPDRICGIELTANGQKIGWSIAEYLTSLDRKVDALINVEQAAKAEPGAK
jgi:F-type H+-transporting ATPase subunit b